MKNVVNIINAPQSNLLVLGQQTDLGVEQEHPAQRVLLHGAPMNWNLKHTKHQRNTVTPS